jgi:hypothetical protein
MSQRTCGGSNAVRGSFPIFTGEAGYSTQILEPLINNARMLCLADLVQTRVVRECLANRLAFHL